jgi:large subunit ribosomal protein L1
LTKGDTAVRGVVKLPNGTGKTVKVAVFAGGDAAEAARAAGADFVGMADLVEKVTKEGWCDFDVAIATVEAMKEVRKCARVLGPRGLMPNPKTGTVTDDTATAVKEAKGGKVDFRMDKTGNIAVVAGKRSFENGALVENIKKVISAVNSAKPASVKGVFIKSITIASTMGVGVPVIVSSDVE